MMRTGTIATLWLLGGGLVSAGLFWWLLNTSEATVYTLTLSVLLAVATFTVAAWSLTQAVQAWHRADGTGHREGAAWWGLWLAVFVIGHLAWLALHTGLDWIGDREGELSAWAIAQLDVSDITPLLAAVQVVGAWCATVVVGFVLLCIGAAGLVADRPAAWLTRALRHALHPLRLLVMSAVVFVTAVVPQHYFLYSMPQGLPATWVQPAVAAGKLAALAVVAAIGGAIVLRLAVAGRPAQANQSPTAFPSQTAC